MQKCSFGRSATHHVARRYVSRHRAFARLFSSDTQRCRKAGKICDLCRFAIDDVQISEASVAFVRDLNNYVQVDTLHGSVSDLNDDQLKQFDVVCTAITSWSDCVSFLFSCLFLFFSRADV